MYLIIFIWLEFLKCDKNFLPFNPNNSSFIQDIKRKNISSLRLTGCYIYACAGRDGLFRRLKTKTTNEWQEISTNWEYVGFSSTGTTLGVRDIYIPPQQEELLFVSLANNDSALTAVYKSTDGGSHWSTADSGLGIEQPLNSSRFYKDATILFSSTFSPETIFTTSRHGFAIFRTQNGGRFWETIIKKEDWGFVPSSNSRINTFSHHPARSFELWAGGMMGSLYKSRGVFWRSIDGGNSWQFLEQTDIPDNGVWSIAIAESTGRIYAGLSGLVIMSENDGANWRKVLDGNQSIDLMQILIDKNKESHLLVGGGTSLFESFDSGTSWQCLVPPSTFISTITWDKITGNVYIGTDSSGVWVGALK